MIISSHVTRCSSVDVTYVAPCGAFHVSYQEEILVKVPAELIHLCRSNHLSVTLLLPVWALGGKVSLLVADKTLNLGTCQGSSYHLSFSLLCPFSSQLGLEPLYPQSVGHCWMNLNLDPCGSSPTKNHPTTSANQEAFP